MNDVPHTYDVGDSVTLQSDVPVLAEGETVAFTLGIKAPLATQVTIPDQDLIVNAAGKRQYTYLILEPGPHTYAFLVTGAVGSYQERKFNVRTPAITF